MPEQAWNWDDLLARPGQQMWRYPLEDIIPFLRQLRARQMTRVYDLGCGAGRHTVLLAAQGFRVWASDISERALDRTRQWLAEAGLAAEDIRQGDMAVQAYPDASFDAIISVHTVYHQTEAAVRLTLEHIGRMLRPGGLLFCTFASTRSSRFLHGQHTHVEPRTLLKPDAGGKADVLQHYVGREHLEDYLRPLRLLRVIHKEEEERHEDFWRHAHFILWAERPGP